MNPQTQTKQFDLSVIESITSRAINSLRKLTDRPKTLCEVLEENLSDEEFKNICKYITVSESGKICNSINDALCSFHWTETKEGREYWAKVYSRFEN